MMDLYLTPVRGSDAFNFLLPFNYGFFICLPPLVQLCRFLSQQPPTPYTILSPGEYFFLTEEIFYILPILNSNPINHLHYDSILIYLVLLHPNQPQNFNVYSINLICDHSFVEH